MMELPEEIGAFHAVLRRRIRDQDAIDGFRAEASRLRPERGRVDQPPQAQGQGQSQSQAPRHVVGQTGCFCTECLVHRKQEWRIGDVNPTIAGPRDQWRQVTWGCAERQALGAIDVARAAREPTVTPTVRETVVAHDVRRRRLVVERDAKFTAVASGKYHTLLRSGAMEGGKASACFVLGTESAGVFACGDNTYGALGAPASVSELGVPAPVDLGQTKSKGSVRLIAASAFASFALVELPIQNKKLQQLSAQESRPEVQQSGTRVNHGEAKEPATSNFLYSWGRGEEGVLGLGDNTTCFTPRIIPVFNSMTVTAISAGLGHVLVLTEMDGVYAFGRGRHGQLGLGDLDGRLTPAKIYALDGFKVIHITAGDNHSIAVTGETFFNRQVYSWGLGVHGQLGHNDDQTRTVPTRINHFRGRKVIVVVAGGSHNLATSETADGVCVWSWGSGLYGQLGHRETWDVWLPRSVDELRQERVRFIDAGERHSLAIAENRQLWLWGKGIHGPSNLPNPDPASTCLVQPVMVSLPGMHIISATAGRDRTFVWGDRAVDKEHVTRSFGGSKAASVCSTLPEHECLTSDAFRILYRCTTCHLEALCVGCAHNCHQKHCLELYWTLEDTLNRDCDCFFSGKCTFDTENDGGQHSLSDSLVDE